MKSANTAKRRYGNTRLLVLKKNDQIIHSTVQNVVDHFKPDDLLIVNRSATLPSSFQGVVERNRRQVEIRLAAFQGPDSSSLKHWLAFSFGAGNWQIPTEQRGEAPVIQAGDRIFFGKNLNARANNVQQGRLLDLQFESSNLMMELYRHGKPIQYAYHQSELQVWDQQTIFSGPPISVEPPSAGFPFTWEISNELKAKGVHLVPLLHSAGLSSTGSNALDGLLPLPERYEVPDSSMGLVKRAKQKGNSIIALGTTALRALESAWAGQLSGITTLKIKPDTHMNAVSGLITGMHEPETSHRSILRALCPAPHVRKGYQEAEARSYIGHEYGDIALLNCN